MESMGAPTPFKPIASFVEQCSMKIEENNKEYTLNFGINGESIYFELYDLKDGNYKYMNIFSLPLLKKKNFWFNQFSSLEKMVKVIKNIMKSNKFQIKEGNINKIIIFFSNPLDEEDIISLELNKEEKSTKEIIKDLLDVTKELKEKNEFLENKINNLEKKFEEKISFFENQINNLRKINEKQNETKRSDLMDSLIISKKADINLLKEWISPNQNKSFELIYRASRDGDTVQDFHRMCDNKTPTISIFKTPKDYIFGGYTTVIFNNPDNNSLQLKDEKAFIFSLNNREKYKTKDKNESIRINPSFLIIFGNGSNSIQIEDNALKSENHWSNPCGSYGDNLKLTENTEFSIVEMEVFQVKTF